MEVWSGYIALGLEGADKKIGGISSAAGLRLC